MISIFVLLLHFGDFLSHAGPDSEFLSAMKSFNKMSQMKNNPNWLLDSMQKNGFPNFDSSQSTSLTSKPPQVKKLNHKGPPESPIRNSAPATTQAKKSASKKSPPINKPHYGRPSSFLTKPIPHSPPGMDESEEDFYGAQQNLEKSPSSYNLRAEGTSSFSESVERKGKNSASFEAYQEPETVEILPPTSAAQPQASVYLDEVEDAENVDSFEIKHKRRKRSISDVEMALVAKDLNDRPFSSAEWRQNRITAKPSPEVSYEVNVHGVKMPKGEIIEFELPTDDQLVESEFGNVEIPDVAGVFSYTDEYMYETVRVSK